MKYAIGLLVIGVVSAGLAADTAQSRSFGSKDPQAGVIIASSDAGVAASRLQELVARDTGLRLPVIPPARQSEGRGLRFILGTSASLASIRSQLEKREVSAPLKPEGFLISTDSAGQRVVVIGGDTDGLRYGVGELWDYHCAIDRKRLLPQKNLFLTRAPAFPMRLFWNWTQFTNWNDDLKEVHQTKSVDAGGTLEPCVKDADGFTRTMTKVIDFEADHKLNGLIVWGFINDAHGGLTAANSVSKYARSHGVRILPGIGTMGYGGFYFGGNHPYNMSTFLAAHPGVRLMVQEDCKPMAGTPCPSDPVFQQWIRDGARWYFANLKDIGGINLEHGDFFHCHCDRCQKLREMPGNDRNYYWDMEQTQVPVIEIAQKANPRLWLTYATYEGYNTETVSHPPQFLSRFPNAAITQWTYTKMVPDPILNPKGSWPDTLLPPEGPRRSIGLLHQGSHWDVKRQWWSASDTPFGGTYSLICDLIREACVRARNGKSDGLEIVGQIGTASPQNELNYLAFEAFTWNPDLTLDQWIDRDLAPLFGGPALARKYYEAVSSTSMKADDLERTLSDARTALGSRTDPRQKRRWSNLVRELERRRGLLKSPGD